MKQNIIEKYYESLRNYKYNTLSVTEILTGNTNTDEILIHCVDGALKLIDAIFLHSILNDVKPKKVLEVGSFLGFSLRWILDATTEFETHVTAVDPGLRHRIFNTPPDYVKTYCIQYADRFNYINAFFSEKNEDFFVREYMNSIPPQTARSALQILDQVPLINEKFDEFDFAFIDGDHSYSATLKNVALAASMMPNGGTIVIHDAITWPDVSRAVEALSQLNAGITLSKIAGRDFHNENNEKWDRWGLTSISPAILGGLCDGLAVLDVSPQWAAHEETSALIQTLLPHT